MFIVSLIIFITQLFALEATHQIRPYSSFEISALNGSCSTMAGTNFSSKCNSALFPYTEINRMELSIVGKSDGDSIDNGYDLVFKPISEDLIKHLFQNKNFNSFTFNSDLVFRTKWFELSYSPYFLLADIYIFNPVFPEISLNVANQETLRLTTGFEVAKWQNIGGGRLSLGSSIFYYDHEYENTVFSLFELSSKKPDELISFKSFNGIASDLGVFIENDGLIPNIALQTKNLFTKIKHNKSNAESSIRMQSLYLFENYSSLGLGKNFKSSFGGFDLNLELPFEALFKAADYNRTMFGARYNLNLFAILLSFNQYYQNIGLKFESQNFNIGLTFSKEKDLGSQQKTSENSVYTGLEIIL